MFRVKRIIVAIFLLCVSHVCYSQKQGNVWCFGDSIGIDFNDPDNPKVFTTVVTSLECNASIADTNGKLLFYFNEDGNYFSRSGRWRGTLHGANDSLLDNGILEAGFTQTNGALILPYYNDHCVLYSNTNIITNIVTRNIYFSYVFIQQINNRLVASPQKVRYTQGIDRPGAFGLSEKVCATRHPDGQSWWIIHHQYGTNVYEVYLLAGDSIRLINQQAIGLSEDQNGVGLGEMCISPPGDKIGFVAGNTIQVVGFDRCKGVLDTIPLVQIRYNFPDLGTTSDPRFYYGCSFSPDGSKFYTGNDTLFQFDLNQPNPKPFIISNPSVRLVNFIQHELLSSNGKIYILSATRINNEVIGGLSTIHSPNLPGLACDLRIVDFRLYPGKNTQLGLPNFANYGLGPMIAHKPPEAGQDTAICLGMEVPIGSPSNNRQLIYRWAPTEGVTDPNSPWTTAQPERTTSYTLTATDPQYTASDCNYVIDRIVVTVHRPITFQVLPDTAWCPGTPLIRITLPKVEHCQHCKWEWGPTNAIRGYHNNQLLLDPKRTTTYTLTLTDTAAVVYPCPQPSYTDSFVVHVLDTPQPEAGKDTTICAGDTVVIGVPPAAYPPLRYQWTNSPTLTPNNTFQASVHPDTTTTYFLTATHTLPAPLRCKTASDSIQVRVVPKTAAQPIAARYLCLGDTAKIKLKSLRPCAACTWRWQPLARSLAVSKDSVHFFPSETTTYTLTLSDTAAAASGCPQLIDTADTFVVHVLDKPQPEAGKDTTICAGDTVVIGAPPAAYPPLRYQWTNSATLRPLNPFQASVYPDTTTTYFLTATHTLPAPQRCKTASDSIQIRVVPQTTAQPIAARYFCSGDTIKIKLKSLRPCASCTWRWQPMEHSLAVTNDSVHFFPSETTTYTISVIDTLNRICSTDSQSVSFNLYRPVSFDLGKDTLICQGDSLSIGVPHFRDHAYYWEPNTGLTFPDERPTYPIAHPQQTTTYTLSVVYVMGNPPCNTSRDTIAITVRNRPIVDAGRDTGVCMGGQAWIGKPGTDTSWRYQWQPETGLSAPQSSLTDVIPAVPTTTYTLTQSDPLGLCSPQSDAVMVQAWPMPSASFLLERDTLQLPFAQLAIQLDTVDNTARYAWDFGNGSVSNLAVPPPVNYPSAGRFTVSLQVRSAQGCVADSSVEVVVLPPADYLLAVPNAFTPNGDGVNDQWQVGCPACVTLSVAVYDRWGRLVFSAQQSNGAPLMPWSGNIPAGVYTYLISYTDLKGNFGQRTGTVTVLY
jgi:gliding motility-associated-like protein